MFCYVYCYLLANELPHWYSKVVQYSLNPCSGLSEEQNPLGIPGLDEINEIEKKKKKKKEKKKRERKMSV